jgi:hypothetical protein
MPGESQYKKSLILPPLKGLNIHDNPLQLTSDFATELVNFMPPTTQLELRPAVEQLIALDGSARALVSFNVGARYKYKEHWYQKTLNYPAYKQLLLFTLDSANTSKLYILNPNSREATLNCSTQVVNYSDDYCLYKTAVFLMMGDQVGSPFCWTGKRGLKRMAWKIGAQNQVPNLENIVTYHDYVFCNIRDTLSIYYTTGDDVDPEADANWDKAKSFFTPKSKATDQKHIELATIAKRGGSIYKMFTFSSQTNNAVNLYFCVLTSNGELLVYQGDNPDSTDAWKLIGIFDIPTPLNRRCFVQLEGDMVVATRNGIVSLSRLIFKQKSEVTEALEWRLSKLFTQYEFEIEAFKEQFFLTYYRNRRLLIFNVPTDMPIPMKDLRAGYIFKAPKSLVFAFIPYGTDNTVPFMDILGFVANYIWKYFCNYTMTYVLNDGISDRIELKFTTQMSNADPTGHIPAVTSIQYYLVLDGVKTDIITPFSIRTNNLVVDIPEPAEFTYPEWNPALNKGREIRFDFTGDQTYEVTEVVPRASTFGSIMNSGDLSLLRRENYNPSAQMQCDTISYSNILDIGIFPENDFATILEKYYLNPDFFRIEPPYCMGYIMKTIAIQHAEALVANGHTDIGGFESELMIQMGSGGYEISVFFTLTSDYLGLIDGRHTLKLEMMVRYVYISPSHTYDLLTCYMSFNIDKLPGDLAYSYDPASKSFDRTIDSPEEMVLMDDTLGAQVRHELTQIKKVDYNPGQPYWDWFFYTPVASIFYPGIFLGNYDNYTLTNYRQTPEWQSAGWFYNTLKTTYPSQWFTSLDNTNYSYESIPLLNNTQVRSEFASVQYVFDCHYNTWSSWKDINMVSAVEHDGEFYFVVDNPVLSANERINKLIFCRFNDEFFGDFNSRAIEASYMSGHIDLKSPEIQKQFTNVKIYGTSSTFWETTSMSEEGTYPFTFMFYTDFEENDPVEYMHRSQLPQGLKRTKPIKLYSFKELKEYNKLYSIASSFVKNIELPMVSNPATRIAVGMKMKVKEHGIIVFGYELYFKPLNP